MEVYPCSNCGKLHALKVDAKYCCSGGPYQKLYRTAQQYAEREYDLDGLKKRKLEELNRGILYERKKKEQRLARATRRECSNCNLDAWHDPDDYMCIECRDGEHALPVSPYPF